MYTLHSLQREEALSTKLSSSESPIEDSVDWTGGSATLVQVLEVVKQMRTGLDYTAARNQVANSRRIAVQSVRDKTTRKLGLDKARFIENFQDGTLRKQLREKFPFASEQIDMMFGATS